MAVNIVVFLFLFSILWRVINQSMNEVDKDGKIIINRMTFFVFTTVFAYAKRELRIEWRFEAILPSFLQSIRCKQKAVDRWLADLHVTLLSV